MAHMHARRMMHRDIKPGNMFVTYNGTLKVGDLGLSRHLSSRTMQVGPQRSALSLLGRSHRGHSVIYMVQLRGKCTTTSTSVGLFCLYLPATSDDTELAISAPRCCVRGS